VPRHYRHIGLRRPCNSVTQLYNKVREQHSEAWLRRTVQYLTACEPFTTSSLLVPPTFAQPPPQPLLPKPPCEPFTTSSLLVPSTFAQPPPQPLLPKPLWFMSVYVRDVMHRLDDVRAKITSVFGTILKMDSTKKVHTLISLGQSR